MMLCGLNGRGFLRVAAGALAALALTLGVEGGADAADITFSLTGRWEQGFPPPTFTEAYSFTADASLQLGAGWYFSSMTVDSPQNAFGDLLNFVAAKYDFFRPQAASNGGSAYGLLGHFVVSAGDRAGLYDRVYLPGGSWRPAAVTITAYYAASTGPGAPITQTVSFPISFVLSSPPGIQATPEPSSIVSAGLAAGGLGIVAFRRRRKRPAAATPAA